MPGLIQTGNRRKRPSRAMSDDDDELSDSSSKRGRHAHDASDLRASNLDASHVTSANPLVQTPFQPGSIVRVKLRNFVTYTAAEFHLGPSLNMVIGPNGTGKSTLVCAICLGLGWSSEHLGRAKDLGEFVKHGCDLAEIEIELAAGPGMASNPIVRRQIRKADNKTQYWLNGKSVPQKKVSELAKEFLIQIDNLCQFLPQDRVVEFAKMSDVDRLRETQRAAAPKHMVEWHDQLKEFGAQEKEFEANRLAHEQQLKKLENQQSATRDDVDRWNERQGLLVKSKAMHKVRPIIECNLRKAALKQAKADIRTVQRELLQIEAEVEPIHQAQAEAAMYRDQIDQVVKTRKNRLDMAKAQADQLTKKIAKAQEDITAFEAGAQGELSSKKAREQDINRLRADIARLERQHREQPVECDTEAWNQQNTEFRTQISAAERRISEINDQTAEMVVRGKGWIQEKQMAEAQLEQLKTQSGKQASLLSKISPDTAKAWDWFLKNRDKLQLRGEVYGPPILTCSIPDSQYASAVESQLRHGDFIAITCINGEDSKILSKAFTRREGGLGLHDIHLRTSPKPLSSYRPPVAPENLSNYGFQGYLVDYIQGPDPVIAMLCDNARLSRTAFASRPLSDQQHTAASASPIQKWVSGREVFMITTRKEYGASSTSVTLLKEASVFIDQPVNSEEKRRFEDTIKRISRDIEEVKEEHNKMKEEKKGLQERIQELRTSREQAQADHEQRRKAVALWRGLPRQIEQRKAEMDAKLQDNAQTTSRIRESRAKMREASLKAALLTVEYAKMVTQLRSFLESLVEAEIRSIEARSETKALEMENKAILDRQKTKQNEIAALQKENEVNRRAYEALIRTTQQMLRELTPAENEIVNEYRTLTSVEELENEITAVTARLDMMAEGNPGAIKTYENREQQIRDCRKKLDQVISDLDSTKQEIAEIRGKWEPQLDALMSRISDAFSHNFEQIGCAGEVSVYKDEEDFDKWSVRIKVRFREGEPLSILDSQRQSGGERAVSTIFYLMALQDLAQSPFRVVDEINQGMDPRNERMVHGRMVDIACQERTSQYFLITPKLLTGLKTHAKMAVHVIYSGEHVPDSQNVKDEWNLNEMAKMAIRRKNRVAVA